MQGILAVILIVLVSVRAIKRPTARSPLDGCSGPIQAFLPNRRRPYRAYELSATVIASSAPPPHRPPRNPESAKAALCLRFAIRFFGLRCRVNAPDVLPAPAVLIVIFRKSGSLRQSFVYFGIPGLGVSSCCFGAGRGMVEVRLRRAALVCLAGAVTIVVDLLGCTTVLSLLQVTPTTASSAPLSYSGPCLGGNRRRADLALARALKPGFDGFASASW